MVDAYVGPDSYQVFLKPGYYATAEDLTKELNSHMESIGLERFESSETQYHKVPQLPTDVRHRLRLSESLSLQMGFEPHLPLCKHHFEPRVTESGELAQHDVTTFVQKATRPVDPTLGLPSLMLIYCDLAEPQLYSDVVTSIIRTVSVDQSHYKYGNMACRTYDRPIYIPVMRRQFHTVEIHIRETTGAAMPFTYGTSTLVLHFRPRA